MLLILEKIKRVLVGNPLESKRERHERLPIPLALAVFASDALSSTAYATEEILLALILSGFALQANALSLPVAVAILLLITVVVISYRQVIRAYPEGGGAYIVSRENLGQLASLVAGGALLIDYVLTVAVSLSGAVAAITSFRMPGNMPLVSQDLSVPLALLFLIVMILVNLRGVRESGKVLAVPAYMFLLSMFALIGYGMFRILTGDVPASVQMDMAAGKSGAAEINWMDMAVVMVMLKAFSHGCSALTGIEAISNGVKAFKSPVDVNANRTMAIMGGLLGIIFTGVTYIAYAFHVQPVLKPGTHEVELTAISLVNAAVFGEGSVMYTAIQILTMVILILAANTSFAGFPRLANLLADDGYLPRQLMSLGDRLVFSNGIMILGVTSAILIASFSANTHYLMPLYAVGVFLSFTLAQTGMMLHHLKHKGKDWQLGAYICGFGAVVTGFVTVLLTVEKFMEGAGIVVIAIPALIYVFMSIKNHYRTIARELTLGESGYCPLPIEHTVLVLVSSLNKGTIPALEYARTISDRVEAVHVELNPIATERLKKSWDEWGCGVTLTILKSPYRSITEPILQYVEEVESRYDHDLVTIIIPEFVTKKFWHNILHNQTSFLIKALLRMKTGKVVTTVRYYLQN